MRFLYSEFLYHRVDTVVKGQRFWVMHTVSDAEPTRIDLWGRRWSWIPIILGVYALSRVFTTVLMLALYIGETLGHWPAASPIGSGGFFAFSATWDSYYYRSIAHSGYPATLPTDSAGHVEQNSWAFLPLYPLTVRGVMLVTGLSFPAAGVIIATLCGAIAALVLYRLVASRAGTTSGLWATLFFCFGPLSFVLQIAYAESMFFALMFASLWAMMERRWWLVLVLATAAAFTRPGQLAIPLALGVLLIIRFWRHRRHEESLPIREAVAMIVTGCVTACAGMAWSLIASIGTGTANAYIQTEISWWTGFIGRVAFVPLSPWLLFTWKYAGFFGFLLVLAAVTGFVLLLSRPSVRALGIEIVVYSASYGLYLFAVFLPQQSLFRLLLPLSPLAGASGLTHSVRARSIVLMVGMVLQPVALFLLWFLGYP